MFKRIGTLIRGFFGLFISGLEKRNPEALIEVEKENLRKQIAEYNKGLAAHAGLCERLMAQVKRLEREADELRAKTTAHLQAGNREAAGRFAFRLKGIQEQLEQDQQSLEDAETTYQELIRTRDVAVKTARDKIETLKRDVDDMKMTQAIAELNEMATGMVGEIGGSGDTLDRLHNMVREERDKAAGRTRLAKDSIDTSEVDALETEQKALEDLALADFAAEAGIALEGSEAEPKPESPDGSASESLGEKTM